jgi:hypothetical protein
VDISFALTSWPGKDLESYCHFDMLVYNLNSKEQENVSRPTKSTQLCVRN